MIQTDKEINLSARERVFELCNKTELKERKEKGFIRALRERKCETRGPVEQEAAERKWNVTWEEKRGKRRKK